MITEKDTIKCEAVYNEDKTHRLLWKRVWNKEKPTACVIMINPCQADTVLTDTTTYLVVNNIARLGDLGGVTIVNLFSLLTPAKSEMGSIGPYFNLDVDAECFEIPADRA